MRKTICMLLVLLSSIILSSCNYKNEHVASQETGSSSTLFPTISETATEISSIPNHTEWKLVKSTKHYSIEKMGLRKYNDYYRCTVYNDKKEGIYSEIIGELNSYPKITISDDTVDIYVGYGTNAFCDKYINYKEELQSVWLDNIYGKGKKHVLAVDGDWTDGSNTKLVVKHMYIQHQEKEYPFPHIKDGCEITKCEFRNNDEEIYIEYTDKDTQKIENKTILLKDFKKSQS